MIPAKEFEGELWVKASDCTLAINKAVESERKACAKICRTYAKETEYYGDDNAEYCFKLAEKSIKERDKQNDGH